ncbi:MAG: ferredoxin family protein [Ignavibacteria bacterium]|nr:ferredoxin family protein [Ignavibacteria bacterium]
MAKAIGEILINIERCKGCELCILACPESTLALSKTINHKGYQYVVKVNDNCTGCGNCAIICPDAVITVYRKILKVPKPEMSNS